MLERACRLGALHSPSFSLCKLLRATWRCSPQPWTCRTISDISIRRHERTAVRVGGSGLVNINIWHAQPPKTGHTASVLVCLPPGPALPPTVSGPDHSQMLHALSTLSPSSTFTSIDYRLSTPDFGDAPQKTSDVVYTYPQPIHDVSVAFAHLLDEVMPSLFPPHEPPRIVLYGSRIGASLASMLALTNPEEVDAVIAVEPLVDWVILDELANVRAEEEEPLRKKPAKDADKELIATAARRLIDMRTKLFRTPSAYYDAFASPALFLRAPGRDTPRTHAEALGFLPGEYNEDWVSSDAYEKAHQLPDHDVGSEHIDSSVSSSPSSVVFNPDVLVQQSSTSSPPSTSCGPYDDDQPQVPSIPQGLPSGSPLPFPLRQVKRRKVLRRWPPNYSSSMVPPLLPEFNIILTLPSPPASVLSDSHPDELITREAKHGLQALLHAQGTEFAELLKRACFFGRESGVAEERVRITEVPGASVDSNDVASFVQQILDKSRD